MFVTLFQQDGVKMVAAIVVKLLVGPLWIYSPGDYLTRQTGSGVRVGCRFGAVVRNTLVLINIVTLRQARLVPG